MYGINVKEKDVVCENLGGSNYGNSNHLSDTNYIPQFWLRSNAVYLTLSMVTFGMDLLSRENSCSSFWAALVGWNPVPGLPDLS